jgi:hypothetical protein
MKKRLLTTLPKQMTSSPEQTRRSQAPDIDAILDSYLERWKGRSTSTKGSASVDESEGTTLQNRSQCLTAREASVLANRVFLAAIIAGKDNYEAQHLARISEQQKDRLIASEEFARRVEAARIKHSSVRMFDLLIELENRDEYEWADEYFGGDFDEYMRLWEKGRTDQIKLLVGAATMRAAGKWNLVSASLRLEIYEDALEWYASTMR